MYFTSNIITEQFLFVRAYLLIVIYFLAKCLYTEVILVMNYIVFPNFVLVSISYTTE